MLSRVCELLDVCVPRLTVRKSVMAMAVSRDHSLALTVSADNLIGRHDILVRGTNIAVIRA